VRSSRPREHDFANSNGAKVWHPAVVLSAVASYPNVVPQESRAVYLAGCEVGERTMYWFSLNWAQAQFG
jgi:hypothetical protein